MPYTAPPNHTNDQYITANGGVKNGVTGPVWQDYYFSTNADALAGALPRHAAFFHAPVFNADLVAREMHAVDSENKRNLMNDDRRIHQLLKWLSTEGHPWRKFGTGNLESLTETARKKIEAENKTPAQANGNALENDKEGDGGPIGREVRERLIEWWSKEYCAGRMTLAVVGKGESIVACIRRGNDRWRIMQNPSRS